MNNYGAIPNKYWEGGGGGGEVTSHFDTKLFRYKSFRYKFIHSRGVNSSTYLA